MALEDRFLEDVPLEDGALTLRGLGCNEDINIPVAGGEKTIDVLITASDQVRGAKVLDVAGAYTIGDAVMAGQFAAFVDRGRVVFALAGADKMRSIASRFN